MPGSTGDCKNQLCFKKGINNMHVRILGTERVKENGEGSLFSGYVHGEKTEKRKSN